MDAKFGELSNKLDDYVGQCERSRFQQERTDNVVMEEHPGRQPRNDNTRRYRCSKEDNKTESLSKSLQETIVLIVKEVSFSSSSLPDMLIAQSCLSESECHELRKMPREKDQIRNMIRLLKGRSFEVMSAFLECLHKECPHVADKISATYKKKVCEYNTKPVCGYCKLKFSQDLPFLADHVWSIGAIDDLVYGEIVQGKRGQKELWALFTEECNKSERILEVIKTIVSALKTKGFHKDLVSKLEHLSELKCTCSDDFASSANGMDNIRVPETTDVDQRSTGSTYSPKSSIYTGNGNNSRNLSDLESDVSDHFHSLPTTTSSQSVDNPPKLHRTPSLDENKTYHIKYGVSKTAHDLNLGSPRRRQRTISLPTTTEFDKD